MTGEEVRKMTDEEMALELKRLGDRIYTLRSQAVTEKVEDLSQFGKIRKDIARLKTEQLARRIKASGGAPRTPKGPRKLAKKPARTAAKTAKKPAAAGAKKPAAKRPSARSAKAAKA